MLSLSFYRTVVGTLKVYIACSNAPQGLVWHRSLAFCKNETHCENKADCVQLDTQKVNILLVKLWTGQYRKGPQGLDWIYRRLIYTWKPWHNHDTHPCHRHPHGIVHLYFGCRNEVDFLHKSQLETLEQLQWGGHSSRYPAHRRPWTEIHILAIWGLGGVGGDINVHVPCVHTWMLRCCYVTGHGWGGGDINVHVPCVHTWMLRCCYVTGHGWGWGGY